MNKNEYKVFSKLFDDYYTIEMSQGIIKGNRVIITEGPLFGYEDKIKKINRHKKRAIIEIKMMGEVREVVVGLEIAHKIPNNKNEKELAE